MNSWHVIPLRQNLVSAAPRRPTGRRRDAARNDLKVFPNHSDSPPAAEVTSMPHPQRIFPHEDEQTRCRDSAIPAK